MKALAITDHGNMYGVKNFHDVATDAGIKPILGCETYVVRNRFEKDKDEKAGDHLILLAKNLTGYHNLCKIVSYSFTEGFYYKPRIDKKLLEQYHEGLICCSACLGGEVPQAIMRNDMEEAEQVVRWFKSVFGDDYYLELQLHPSGDPRKDADVYENWTDVSGFLMADPKIVKDPKPIERITYAELRELSYIGAQVLHEGTVSPVREKNIPLNIRNTNQPEHPGTMIRESFDESETERSSGSMITGIAGKKGFSVITLTKNGMSSELGAVRRILEVLERYSINVDYLPSGIDSVSLVVETGKSSPYLYQAMGDLEKEIRPDSLHLTDGMAIVAAVGRKMAFQPGSSGKIFGKLGENGINIRMITQGPEELNIIVGVDGPDFERAIRVLYDSFVK
jgi:hypothetical protein